MLEAALGRELLVAALANVVAIRIHLVRFPSRLNHHVRHLRTVTELNERKAEYVPSLMITGLVTVFILHLAVIEVIIGENGGI